ncbi:MAG TPA: DJ-1/PfpI family protein [Bacteroidia bacterium]|nr:DJ-1/PfpI family protein [Bacteroidia bacterium]
MKNVVFIVPPELFRDEELFRPMEILNKSGIHTEIASTAVKTITGMKGVPVTSSRKINQIDPEDYEMFVVIGGSGTQTHLWRHQPLLDLLSRADKAGKLIAGICAGSVVLAHAGLLNHKNATTFAAVNFINELKNSGAVYTQNEVEVSGNIITGSGPDAAKEFGKALVYALGNKKDYTHESISIPLHSPFDDI